MSRCIIQEHWLLTQRLKPWGSVLLNFHLLLSNSSIVLSIPLQRRRSRQEFSRDYLLSSLRVAEMDLFEPRKNGCSYADTTQSGWSNLLDCLNANSRDSAIRLPLYSIHANAPKIIHWMTKQSFNSDLLLCINSNDHTSYVYLESAIIIFLKQCQIYPLHWSAWIVELNHHC